MPLVPQFIYLKALLPRKDVFGGEVTWLTLFPVPCFGQHSGELSDLHVGCRAPDVGDLSAAGESGIMSDRWGC